VLETREQTELKEDDQMLETSGSKAMKFAHIMLDIETLSTKPNALVLSIGMVLFQTSVPLEQPINQWYRVLPYRQQQSPKTFRLIESSTLEWWEKQSEEAQRVLRESRELETLMEAILEDLIQWFGSIKSLGFTPVVWGKGANFDNVIVESLLNTFGYPKPWSYKADMCYRTLLALKGWAVDWEELNNRGLTHHHALKDAEYQAQATLQMLTPEELHTLGNQAFTS
jgi:hypothetical protein